MKKTNLNINKNLMQKLSFTILKQFNSPDHRCCTLWLTRLQIGRASSSRCVLREPPSEGLTVQSGDAATSG